MPAPLKRRRSYYLSLPVVVTVVLLLVAKLVAMQRAEIIAELSDRVEHHEPEDATAAIRQLGEMPRPPVGVLIAAAAGADRAVAREAQQAITRLLRRAQQQLEAGRGAKSVSRQLTDLARELANYRHAFPAGDQDWLVSTAQRILRLANEVPQNHAPIVAANCDLILTSFPASAANELELAVPHNSAASGGPSSAPAVALESSPVNSPSDVGEPADAKSNDSFAAPWRADRPQPVFRSLPTNNKPIDTAHPTQPSSAPPELPPDVELIGRPIANADTRILLQKWFEAVNENSTPFEQQRKAMKIVALELALRQRGFDRPPAPLVQKLFSTPEYRLQLVDEVLNEPEINPQPWLVLLAGDPDPDVRLAAVTVMATSTDAELVEQAWQVAIHDRDPRVAALAKRLRERRTASQRR